MKLYRTQDEYDTKSFPAGGTISIGMTLDFVNGVLVEDLATPSYVALSPAKSGEECLVHEIRKDEDYSGLLSVSGASLTLGDTVTLVTGGKVTATTTDGIFKINEFVSDTKAAGTTVVGRFI